MFFDSLQALRGFAAIAVLLYHVNTFEILIGHNPTSIFQVFSVPFSYGAWLFFVLSGFLMASLLDRGYEAFLLRRVLRIYPAYLTASGLALCTKVLVFGSVSNPHLLRAITLLPLGATVYPLGVEWTLVYEMCFYLVCSVFSWSFGRRVFPYFLAAWAVAILAVRVFGRVPYSLLPTPQNALLAPFDLLFICGGLSFYLARRIGQQAVRVRISEGIFGGALVVLACQQPGTFARCILLGIAFSLVMLGVLPWTAKAGNRMHDVLRKLGDYSYGMYLAQVPVVTIIYAGAMVRLHLHVGSAVGAVALLAALVAGAYMGKLDVVLHDTSRAWAKALTRRTARRRYSPIQTQVGADE